jgi:hypothetical protein
MTLYGINPSFCGPNSRLPLFSQPVRRGRRFEVFTSPGQPTGTASPLGADGLPVDDGRRHGLRLFLDMDGRLPVLEGPAPALDVFLTGNLLYVSWIGPCPVEALKALRLEDSKGQWHVPSMRALKALHPTALRTLDWQNTNHYQATRDGLLYGGSSGMRLSWQVQAANLLDSHLWWPCPTYDQVHAGSVDHCLRLLAPRCKRPPVLEYGNELWNTAFPAAQALRERAAAEGVHWTRLAARDIAIFHRAALEAFDGRPFFTFVGGFIQEPSILGQILEYLTFEPDFAGPAMYVGPLRAHREEWQATGAVPSQDELRASCHARLDEVRAKLDQHAARLPEGTSLAVYEAGFQSLCGQHPWGAAVEQAHREEWMGDLYWRIRREAEAAEVTALNWYSAATSQRMIGSVEPFGLLEGLDYEDLPKVVAARGD